MKPMFEMLAGYNDWANRRLYDAAAGLADADYRADHSAFFGSVHGTLNHLLVGDRVWMHRFTGEGPSPTRLDEVLYDDFAGLRAAREAEDARIMAYVASLARSDLDGTIRYRTISRGYRAGAEARAATCLQPPDPSPRSGALPVDADHRRGTVARPDPLSA